jgi:hypothetical protein
VRHRVCDPERRDAIVCRLRHERLRLEAFRELPRHLQGDVLVSAIAEHCLDRVGRAQIRGALPLRAFEVAQTWMTRALHVLGPYGPA